MMLAILSGPWALAVLIPRRSFSTPLVVISRDDIGRQNDVLPLLLVCCLFKWLAKSCYVVEVPMGHSMNRGIYLSYSLYSLCSRQFRGQWSVEAEHQLLDLR